MVHDRQIQIHKQWVTIDDAYLLEYQTKEIWDSQREETNVDGCVKSLLVKYNHIDYVADSTTQTNDSPYKYDNRHNNKLSMEV